MCIPGLLILEANGNKNQRYSYSESISKALETVTLHLQNAQILIHDSQYHSSKTHIFYWCTCLCLYTDYRFNYVISNFCNSFCLAPIKHGLNLQVFVISPLRLCCSWQRQTQPHSEPLKILLKRWLAFVLPWSLCSPAPASPSNASNITHLPGFSFISQERPLHFAYHWFGTREQLQLPPNG